MLEIKKIISIFFILPISIYSFAADFTHNDVIELIQNSGDLEKLEEMIKCDETLVNNSSEFNDDCIITLFDTKYKNFESDSEFDNYAKRVIGLLPNSYWLTKNINGNYPLFTILEKCNVETELTLINFAIDKTTNLNIENDKHQTPLSYIATYFDMKGVELIRTLLRKGADVNYKNSNDCTAIMYSAECNKNIEIFSELYCFPGIKTNGKNANGESLSILASKNENPVILQYLLDKNSFDNTSDFYGKTPLMHACEKGLKDNVKILLNYAQNINQQDNFGKTALMYAMEKNKSKDISKILIKNGADKKIRDNKNFTAYDYKEANAYLSRSKMKNWKVVIIVIIITIIVIIIFVTYFILKLYSAKEYRYHFDRRKE